MKKLIILLLLIIVSSCSVYRPPSIHPHYITCEDELKDCYTKQQEIIKEHNKQMRRAFFGTLLVVTFMHWTR